MFEPRRKYLVFSSIDTDRTTLFERLRDVDRCFDLAVYVYRGKSQNLDPGLVDFVLEHPGYKFQNFYHFSQHIDIGQYSAVWLADEDVILSTGEIDRMFELFTEHDLSLAQPAYDRPFNWELLLVDERYRLRFTNFVENGAAILSRAALARCLDTMRLSRSGWGLDFIWPALCGFPSEGIAVIDEVVLECPELESSLENSMDRSEREAEGRRLMDEFGATFFVPRVTGGILKSTD